MRAYERLLKYVSVYTPSDPDSATVPSSMRQYDPLLTCHEKPSIITNK